MVNYLFLGNQGNLNGEKITQKPTGVEEILVMWRKAFGIWLQVIS